ncbi:39S ribosomal protein L47, mitochondrial [Clupea harengus]|uniref:Large ribosomal subunit protein uL29m n=1 Tax=Clupea harengus TaxID=7950 RepID=A0A6P3WF89_CLUHA|nr:39S ribosomal protein L47, mitochondrial [Clupea harengus]
MAATSAGRIAGLCRQFQRCISIAPSFKLQTEYCSSRCGSLSNRPSSFSPALNPAQYRLFHTSQSRKGLEDFFDPPENWGETTVKSGAPWTAKQLRAKSNEDLHKLWYVLLKEKNMLLTTEQESKRQRLQMPGPERLKKVERSMTRLDSAVQEREGALRLLLTGQEKGRPGEWRRNVFGHVYWYRFREHPIPWHLNSRYRRKRFFTPEFVEPHMRLRLEKRIRSKVRKAQLEKQKEERQAELFPKASAQTA